MEAPSLPHPMITVVGGPWVRALELVVIGMLTYKNHGKALAVSFIGDWGRSLAAA